LLAKLAAVEKRLNDLELKNNDTVLTEAALSSLTENAPRSEEAGKTSVNGEKASTAVRRYHNHLLIGLPS